MHFGQTLIIYNQSAGNSSRVYHSISFTEYKIVRNSENANGNNKIFHGGEILVVRLKKGENGLFSKRITC